MNTCTVHALGSSLALAASLGCAAPDAVGRVSVALGAGECASYCAAELRAEIYRVDEEAFPLGPAAQGACGASLDFDGLPAGTEVVVALDVFDDTGARRLTGRSAPVTVVADGEASASITVTPLAPPTLTGASPDPVVVDVAPVLVTLAGANLGTGLGDSSVTLGGEPLSTAWAEREVAVTAGLAGGELVVRACGIASNAVPLRVLGPTLGRDAVSVATSCEVRALAVDPSGDGAFVAFGCPSAADSFIQRFRADDVCPLDGDEVWHLAGRPTAVAPGWVALDDGGVAAFDAARAGDAAAAQGTGRATALAAVGTRVYGIVDGRLARVDAGIHAVSGVDAGLTLVALAPLSDELAVLASSGDEGRVVSVTGAAEAVVARSVTACHGPRALTADAARFVVACGDGLAVVARASGEVKLLDDVVADAVALDPRGDIAVAWTPGDDVAVVDLAAGAVLRRFAGAPASARPLLAPLPSDPAVGALALLATGAAPSALAVWTPYDEAGPCR